MSQFERIAFIDRVLREHGGITAKDTAQRFEVSIRQIKRDIEYLRDRLLAPIAYDAKQKIYRYEQPFDALRFADEKLLLFYVLLKSLALNEHYVPVVSGELIEEVGSRVSKDYRTVSERISYELPISESVDMEDFTALCQAMLLQHRLDIEYKNAKGEQSKRSVEPERLLNYGGRWYLIAFDLLRGDLRTFHLSRLLSVSISRERSTNCDRPEYRQILENYLASGFGIFKGRETESAVIRVRGLAAALIARQTWHPEQLIRQGVEPDGTPYTDMTLPVADWRELLGRVLSFGASAEAIAPPVFRHLWREEIRKMAEQAEKVP